MKGQTTRLKSIDVFRAITMLLMIFVNDVSGVKGIPPWIEHVKADDDGLGFADTVFPAFLFIVGLSLPFAIEKRLHQGVPALHIAGYISTRSLALIVMGFFHVNLENYNAAALLPRPLWQIGVTASFFLIWLDYSPNLAKKIKIPLITAGIVGLLLLAFLYKGGNVENPEPMKPHWWGILGIIGWAYLVSAFVFLLARGKMLFMVAALVFFLWLNISAHTGLPTLTLPIMGDASSISLIFLGAVTTCLYQLVTSPRKMNYMWIVFCCSGVLLIAAGLFLRPLSGGISKIHSTPSWVFICAGISLVIFELLTWIVDINQKSAFFNLIRPAGTSTLTCYLLPYLLYAVYELAGFQYPAVLNEGLGGIIRSFLVAFFIIFLTGILEKRKLRLSI